MHSFNREVSPGSISLTPAAAPKNDSAEEAMTIPNQNNLNPAPETQKKTGNSDFLNPQGENNPSQNAMEYEQMIDNYSGFDTLTDGEIIKGKVIAVTATEVIVDVGYKSEGIIPIQEFLKGNGSVEVQAGQEIEVVLERSEDLEGRVILSHERAQRLKAWDQIEKAHNEQTILHGIVVEKTKGGLFVDIGVKAFLPGSQIDTKPVRNLDGFKGQIIECKVIKLNKKRNNIVLSRRVLVEERENKLKAATLAGLTEGALLAGKVKNITDYGVFIDLGGIDGLLHISDITWGRPKHPSHYFTIGQEVQVKVLKFDSESNRVSLGLKQLTADPWESVNERYPVNSRVRGTVISLTDYGAFVELETGVEGLIHISEMTWSKRLKAPSKLLGIGATVEVVVLGINPLDRKISLGLKQTQPDPWQNITERHPVNSIVSGKVRNLTEFGAFVEVEEGIDGLIHISDLSWSRNIKHPSEVIRKGEVVQAIVLNADPEHRRLSLGLKQLRPNIWDEFAAHHQIGDLISGTIVRFASFGAFVELEEGIEGLCHISEFDDETAAIAQKGEGAGASKLFRILRILPKEKRIGLSLLEIERPQPAEETLPPPLVGEPSNPVAPGDALSPANNEALDNTIADSSPSDDQIFGGNI
jgi:small subunit ribosomal protein S1